MSSMPTQTSENREIVSRAISEVIGDGDFEGLAELYAEEFEQHGGPSGDLQGLAAFRAWIEQIHTGFPDFTATEEFSICEDDLVASYVTYTGTHDGEFLGIPATGASVETTGLAISRVRDGKIVESWPRTDMLRVLQQVGVLETPEE